MDISARDKAATHVNIGILHMRAKRYDRAAAHYQTAIAMRPDLPEAHINYGANLIYQKHFHKAIEQINIALDLGTRKLPEAYYNRAMAYDNLKRYDDAYRDLQSALKHRPEWPPAVRALSNYELVAAVKKNQG